MSDRDDPLIPVERKKETDGLILPVLLAGPILRRAEPSQVCIWIACRRPFHITAEIFQFRSLLQKEEDQYEQKAGIKQADNNAKKGAPVIGRGTANSMRLGENLHIALVVAHPLRPGKGDMKDETGASNYTTDINTDTTMSSNINGYPTDELLAYDIEITYNDDSSRKSYGLKDFNLVNAKNSIVYSNIHHQSHKYDDDRRDNDDMDSIADTKARSLPTFFLRGQKTPLNVLYGSCRKLHGKGEDCLAIADELIASAFDNLQKRPSVLFLTGDQIYADDVSNLLIQYLTQFGIKLSGYEEEIEGIDKKPSEIGIGERQELVQEYAKFTSDNAGNHLLTFSEFSAMHLLAWNIENWPRVYPSFDSKDIDSKKYHDEIVQLEKARKALPAVRRVLANIPTYMICDDHEITDDWNITKEWYESVRTSSCGKQIVANGLAAYWAFQAWGNDPDSFSENFVQIIIDYLMKNGKVSSYDREAFEDYLWNFHGWTFIAPITPCTLFLDCRTQHHFDSLAGPPQLLNEDGLLSLREAVSHTNYKMGDPLVLVSPTPVFGFDLAEELQKYLAKKSSVYKWDLETWAANERGFVRFITFIIRTLKPCHCVFLSGDVHYGFTQSATFTILSEKGEYGKDKVRGGGGEANKDLSLRISQLNSSALKTTSVTKEFILTEVLSRARQFFSSGHSVRVGWKDTSFLHAKKLKEDITSSNIADNWPAIINRIAHNDLAKSNSSPNSSIKPDSALYSLSLPPPPDWIESRSIIKNSGSGIPVLVVSDNNLGWVTVEEDKSRVSHQLITRSKKSGIKIHTAIMEMNRRT
jgi:hypothetical protein